MSFSSSYNAVDRGLHYFAFFSPLVQKILSELENDIFKNELKAVESRNEVFITGLPRAGTTLMLELLYSTGEFSTYTYRNMPFVLAPLLWNWLSQSFRKASKKRERAHGDGMEISVDSPEAFEEVVWLTYMANKIVRRATLSTLSGNDVPEEFRDAIRNSVRKILALAQQTSTASGQLRYLSKNNSNISRIDVLPGLFPTSKILIVFRSPLAHISSLAWQHQRFLLEHESDTFSRKYMEWIGHYEFGKNFKPIDFGGWLGQSELPSRIDEAFWLGYWNAAYAYALEHKTDNVIFVDYEQLLVDRAISLKKIAIALDLKHAELLLDAGKRLRSPTTRPAEFSRCPPTIWKRAQQIHSQLVSEAV